jgi:eukaryotic-like serine/threonine-protein kinase
MDNLPLLNNRYKLLQTIGKGGMSFVYSAYDLMLDRPVAIKVLKQELSMDQAFRDRFHLEAKAAANLTHPSIVTVHDFGFDQNCLFIVMEHVPGTDLKTLLLQRGRIPMDEALPLFIQACSGIGYAHRAGLVHCDIKPHNMLVTPDWRLKVTDFGIARALASIHPDEKNNEIWGSPQYFSPEQAAGLAPQPASDVYGLGVVMYEALTGQLPFYGENAQEYAYKHLHEPPIPPSKLNPQIPPEMDEIILKVLSKEPSQRYRTADQLGRVLQTNIRTGDDLIIPDYYPPQDEAATVVSTPTPTRKTLTNAQEVNSIDWITIGLGLLTVAAVGGLIPLWIAVLFNLL